MIPGLGGLTGLPGLGGLPGMPTMPGMPGLGGLPGMTGIPGMPGLGGLPGMRPPLGAGPNLAATLAALQASGSLPKLGGLPGMPGLPGLPGIRPNALPSLLRPPAVDAAAAGVPGGVMSKAGGAAPAAGAVGMLSSLSKASGAPPSLPSASAPCTVYVGRISSEVSDDFVKGLLEKCGTVTKWNRAADPNTSKLTSFGFCDFEEPQGVWRALECLHEKQLCDKRLLVKCEEKAKETIDQWKNERKVQFQKKQKESEDAEKKEAIANPEKAGREAFAKSIAAAKKAKEDGPDAEAEKKEGPLTEKELNEKLLEESKDAASAIANQLQEKNKGYPELTAENEKDADVVILDDDKKAEVDLTKKDDDKENDTKKENDKDKDKDKDSKAKDGEKTEEKGKKRTRSEERKAEKEAEKEAAKKAAISRHYRAPRRERDREDRLRTRERDIEKEYQYRIREFERNEEQRIKRLKRDLEALVVVEPTEREIRKFSERDLNFDGDREEREWKRYREDRAKERAKEKEKDNADRAGIQKELDEEKKKKEKQAEERRIKKEKEEEEVRRKQEEEEKARKEAEEKKEREEREAEEAEKRRIEEEELAEKEAEKKKIQKAAADKLLLAVQEEMKKEGAEQVLKKTAVITGSIDGPSSKDKEGREEKGRSRSRDRPAQREPEEERKPAPAAAPTGNAAVDAKLKDDEMRRLIQQVPTEKAKAFAFEIDWDVVHKSSIIEKKLRPWVRKKVTEFLGAEEQGMIEFIMRKVSSHTAPATILAELEGFIDEEAENFTLKMWRMLIFEVLRVKAR